MKGVPEYFCVFVKQKQIPGRAKNGSLGRRGARTRNPLASLRRLRNLSERSPDVTSRLKLRC